MSALKEHTGNCRVLGEIMPDEFGDLFEAHRDGPEDECFRNAIKSLVMKAAAGSPSAVEYAILCNEICELFDTQAGGASNVSNPFKYLLTNQCHLLLTTFR